MFRFGDVKASAGRLAALVRGTRDNLAGSRRAVVELAPREGGASNTGVLGYLAARNPALLQGLDAAARAAVAERWRRGGVRTRLEELTYYAGQALAAELAARLRSGRVVSNLPATLAAKIRRGLGNVPGVATEALAKSLDSARVSVE